MSNETSIPVYEHKFGARASSVVFVHCTVKNVAVKWHLFAIVHWFSSLGGKTAQVQWPLCAWIGTSIVIRWVVWNRDEHNGHSWTCRNMMHAVHTVTSDMANVDESFNQEMKWQLVVAWHAVSKQDAWSCTVGQHGYGVLWIAYWVMCGLK
jgi:hypothetical protein